mgnify:CR=1 FL=1
MTSSRGIGNPVEYRPRGRQTSLKKVAAEYRSINPLDH